MGEFIEPEGGGTGDVPLPKPKVFSEAFLTSVVKKSIESGDIQPDDKLTLVGIVNEEGAQAIVVVSILDKEAVKVKFNSVFEHKWTGDNTAGAKVIVSVK